MDNILSTLVFLAIHGTVFSNSDSTDLTCSFETDFCGWENERWVRKTKSGFASTGPEQADDGNYFIHSELTIDAISIIKGNVPKKSSGQSCLKFRFYHYGPKLGVFEYGIILNNGEKRVRHTFSRDSEQFWYCSTFDLSDIPDATDKIYFQVVGKDDSSTIALDNFVYTTGSDCSDTVSCSRPATTTTTTTAATNLTAVTPDVSNSNAETQYIIGGVVGGVLVILAIVIVIVFVIKRKYSQNTYPPAYSSSQANSNRQLPAIPQNSEEDWSSGGGLSIAESMDRQFSIKPEKAYVKKTEPPKRERPESQAYTDIADTKSVQSRETPDDDYIHVTPDYSDDGEDDYDNVNDPSYINTGFVNEQDDDYLEPVVGPNPVHAPDNQYESDPTEKNTTNVVECAAPSTTKHSLEIPRLPAMNKNKILKLINKTNGVDYTDEDYDDATTLALDATSVDIDSDKGDSDNNSKQSDTSLHNDELNKEDKISVNEDYLDMKDKQSDDDYLDMKDKQLDDDYLDMKDKQSDDDYIKPSTC